VTGKAWRFVGEMEEISSTFRDAGLPGEFHAAAAAIYRRLVQFKDAPAGASLEDVLSALLQTENELNAAKARDYIGTSMVQKRRMVPNSPSLMRRPAKM